MVIRLKNHIEHIKIQSINKQPTSFFFSFIFLYISLIFFRKSLLSNYFWGYKCAKMVLVKWNSWVISCQQGLYEPLSMVHKWLTAMPWLLLFNVCMCLYKNILWISNSNVLKINYFKMPQFLLSHVCICLYKYIM